MTAWVKSSYCDTSSCVEVSWARSSHCGGGDCVEVSHAEGDVLMRDSKNPNGPVLRFTRDQWQQFIHFLKD